jgi:hypothetical protein
MNPSTGNSSSDAEPQPRESTRRPLREAFESLSLASQFRLTAIAAVTVTLLAIQVVTALWDTRSARDEAVDHARNRTTSMAARLKGTGGGALDDLAGHPEFLAATFSLQGGEVLQQYVRDDRAAEPGSEPPAALRWMSSPTGWRHWIKSQLALEPIYVESSVELSPGLSGSISILVDHRWIWNHALRRVEQAPIALLLGCLVALLAANSLKRRVVEPLAQLAQTTRVSPSPENDDRRKAGRRRNELTQLATNFDALADRLAEYERAMRTERNASCGLLKRKRKAQRHPSPFL